MNNFNKEQIDKILNTKPRNEKERETHIDMLEAALYAVHSSKKSTTKLKEESDGEENSPIK